MWHIAQCINANTHSCTTLIRHILRYNQETKENTVEPVYNDIGLYDT
jgi:hypothetical protein